MPVTVPRQLRASVVVCTRNRSTLLVEACELMLAMEFPPSDWELLVVDNGSTDDTVAVAEQLVARHPTQVRLVEEAELGLSAARNAGIRHAHGTVIAFIDDDAFPEIAWLGRLVAALDSGAMAAGGAVRPRFETPPPAWLDDRYLPYLTAWDPGDHQINLVYNEYPRGANIAFRREAFERYGVFSTHLGRKGGSLLSGEETEICLRLERGGETVLYVPGASVDHVIHGDRITPEWLVARFGAQGRSEAIIHWMHGGFSGMWHGLKRARNFRVGTSGFDDDAGLHERCQKSAYAAYGVSALTAPLRIRGYRPPANGSSLAPWHPGHAPVPAPTEQTNGPRKPPRAEATARGARHRSKPGG